MIPRVAHFVFGLGEQDEPFHFLHYASLESCRRMLVPERIYLHHKWLPWGPWWERIRPHVTLVEVDLVEEVLAARYLPGRVPAEYLYAHHTDFIRLDALIEHGGVYADLDTIFLRPWPAQLFEEHFVIGREPPVSDERTGEMRVSLCNALLMSEPGAQFARAWRAQMAEALNGTWSNHSGFLPERLSSELPAQVRVEPEVSFFPFGSSRAGLSQLLEQRLPVPVAALSVHLWAHLWWDRRRRDFSHTHAGWCTPPFLRQARTTLAKIMRPYLPDEVATHPAGRPSVSGRSFSSARSPRGWSYLALDEESGYGVAADRCMAALEAAGVALEWTPFVPGNGWGLGYEPLRSLGAGTSAPIVIAHLVPEYFPLIRKRNPDAFVVGHTVWDTDRIPDRWISCLDSADLLVVPSEFSAEAIAASPVTTPVAVVPHIAPQMPEPASLAAAPQDSEEFVFYTIAEWNERKAVYKTVDAYLRAFTGADPVLLIIKTSHRDHTAASPPAGQSAGAGTTAWSLARLIANHPDPPAVRLVTRVLSDGEIAALHRQGGCFVSLCRGEGFGLGAFDAAAHGNPVVTTGFGGHLDYLGDSSYLVEFKLVPVIDPAGYPTYAPDQRWADPDIEHGASLLRQVAAERDRAATVASSLAAEIRWRFRPEAIASAFRSVVDEHDHRPAERTATAAVTRRR